MERQRLAPSVEGAIFRIVQEALTNAERHSQTRRIRIELTQAGSRVLAVIQDWGIGFDSERVEPGHFGVSGIRERARLLGGNAIIRSATGQGTIIEVDLPVEDTADPGTL